MSSSRSRAVCGGLGAGGGRAGRLTPRSSFSAIRAAIPLGAKASARNGLSCFSRSSIGASAHYFIDQGGALCRSLSEGNTSWHVGCWAISLCLVGIEAASDGAGFTEACERDVAVACQKFKGKVVWWFVEAGAGVLCLILLLLHPLCGVIDRFKNEFRNWRGTCSAPTASAAGLSICGVDRFSNHLPFSVHAVPGITRPLSPSLFRCASSIL